MASPRDPSSDQLNDYKKKVKKPGILLTASGIPVANKSASLTVGPNGPLLMQDVIFLDEFSHFSRERIPERTVHAKGAGAFGYFEVTHDISKYSKASVFSEIGKKTPIFVRFSTVPGENDSPDTVRTVRGFAVKFYTEQGIWDLIGNNTPIFFLRDPMLFPSLIHTQKRNPVTHLSDLDMYWDFLSLRPETTNQVIRIFADEGIPDGYRYMDGHGVNTFKLVNRLNESYYCKFHYKSDQGKKYLFAEEAARLTAINPDYATKDLYNSIAKGEYPSWTFYIQVMTLGQADSYKFNPFDATKVWSESEFPLIPVGKLVLNRNPENYFADVEQAAFNPQHMPPGIEASPDKVLQGRLLAYGDAQRHRVGPNHLQLAVNCPYKAISSVTNYQRDGFMSVHNQDGAPNYFPNSFRGPVEDPSVRSPSYHVSGDVARHEPPEDDYSQAGDYWRKELSEDQRARCVRNLVDSLRKASVFIIERSVGNFASADAELGRRLIDGLRKAGVPINAVARSASL